MITVKSIMVTKAISESQDLRAEDGAQSLQGRSRRRIPGRISWFEHERRIVKTHVLSLRPTLVRCGLRTLDRGLFESLIESPGGFALASRLL
jgi:hypothetical protein